MKWRGIEQQHLISPVRVVLLLLFRMTTNRSKSKKLWVQSSPDPDDDFRKLVNEPWKMKLKRRQKD
jgi:hypothetical protein